MAAFSFFNRDLSWLSFNGRILEEAAQPGVPLLERVKFLSIYSSNLDEFYRVRMPVIMALGKINKPQKNPIALTEEDRDLYRRVTTVIHTQLEDFGAQLREKLLPQLLQQHIHFVYNEPVPAAIRQATTDYFFTTICAFLQIIKLHKKTAFFPVNNALYLAVTGTAKDDTELHIINIPSGLTPRFFSITESGIQYILFIDDIIRDNLDIIFPAGVDAAYSFKITRDAELDLEDEYEGDMAEKIEKQISKRDFGLATRFLHQPDLPAFIAERLIESFNLSGATPVAGGRYHNLKDFNDLPVSDRSLQYARQHAIRCLFIQPRNSLFSEMQEHDILVNTPYQSYDTILRFFNEAAIDKDVEEIYLTMYRIAHDSKIAHALISASANGKKVTVCIELKARFDEANNLKWGKRMKDAGIIIIYSIPGLKVHAKVALIKKRLEGRIVYYGLMATGNLNETTARFYTDHILLSCRHDMMRELELLFLFLIKRRKPYSENEIIFSHLLVAQFNLQQRFTELIEREITIAKSGLLAQLTIKLNNLEEHGLTSKLYEASNAGVQIKLLVRSICCLEPGIDGQSKNIRVKRIVDRYLEHGRVFIFHNNGDEEVYLGSADWMNRNIYRRIEVCFPVYAASLKKEIKAIINLQWQDMEKDLITDDIATDRLPQAEQEGLRAQQAVYHYLQQKGNTHEN